MCGTPKRMLLRTRGADDAAQRRSTAPAIAITIMRAAHPRQERPLRMDPLLARITIDPNICHGKPCVRGLRYPVEVLLELLSSGMTTDEILADYEDLERDDLLAALAFAARLARTRRLQPVGP